jgi:hypothetical protein
VMTSGQSHLGQERGARVHPRGAAAVASRELPCGRPGPRFLCRANA